MKKNAILSTALAILIACSAAGCSSGDRSGVPADSRSQSSVSADTPDAAGSSAGSGVTLELWTNLSAGTVFGDEMPKFIAKWEEKTGNTVNHSSLEYDMMHEKLIAAGAANNTPDISWGLSMWSSELYHMGLLADLTSYWESWADKDQIYESVVNTMKIGDQFIGVPYEINFRALVVHDDLLAQSGYAVPKTWDDVLRMTDFKDKTGAYAMGLCCVSVRAPQELVVHFNQLGLEICSLQADGLYKNTWLDNPGELEKAAQALQYYVDLVNAGIVDPNSTNYSYEVTDDNFVEGLCAMYACGNWLGEREDTQGELLADVSVHPIPYPAGGKPTTHMEIKPMFIYNTCKNADVAFDLATTICSKEAQEVCCSQTSPRMDVFSDTKWSKDFNALAETAIAFPSVTMGGIEQAMIDAVANVLQNNLPTVDAAGILAEEVNASLADTGELSAQ